MTPVFVGLGSNLDRPQVQLERAASRIRQIPQSHFVRCSPMYWTPPWGDVDQPDFLNAVVELSTELEPAVLLKALQQIEDAQGRKRDSGRRWGPRPLDLDLLLYGQRIIDEPGLQVPHPRMIERAFVLVPLMDLAPEIVIPGRGRASEWLKRLDVDRLRRAEDAMISDHPSEPCL